MDNNKDVDEEKLKDKDGSVQDLTCIGPVGPQRIPMRAMSTAA